MIKFHIDEPVPNKGRITVNGAAYEFSYNMAATAVINNLQLKGIVLSEEQEKQIKKLWK